MTSTITVPHRPQQLRQKPEGASILTLGRQAVCGLTRTRLLALGHRGSALRPLSKTCARTGWNVQVWLRDDNTWQLDFRDGTAAEHYQARVISQEKVTITLSGRVKRRLDRKKAFLWNSIGASFGNAGRPCRRPRSTR